MTSDTISIRPPATIADYQAIERLQVEIWGSDLGVSPLHLVLTIAKEGGVVLMAFDGELPVGFVFGFLGLTQDNRLKLASHQAGVLPAYQDRGLGYRLKLAQRAAALAKNLDLITWTYDPLQCRNGRLNLRKLGAVCNTYIPNLYGEMSDALNQGLPSDRFRVDWWIATEYVAQRLRSQYSGPEPTGTDYPILNPATMLDKGLMAPADTIDPPQGHYCLVEVPVDLTALKQEAPHLALQWRLQTRDIFETAFSQGYTVTDLIRRAGRNYYLLEKNWQPK
jgi:predicted GNAT superfamily acetyltransferase